jgi:hypothetical protein
METRGVLEARIELSNSSMLHEFQLVNKQVDIILIVMFMYSH